MGKIRYRISRRQTLLHGDTFIRGGELLPDGILNQKTIDEHVRSGFLLVAGSENDREQLDTGASMDLKPIVAREKDGTIKDDGRELRMSDPNKAKSSQRGKWSADPALLKNLTLEDLNLRVAAIDHDIQPFETKQEAIAQLSADFRNA